jgi:hypothetical protein
MWSRGGGSTRGGATRRGCGGGACGDQHNGRVARLVNNGPRPVGTHGRHDTAMPHGRSE